MEWIMLEVVSHMAKELNKNCCSRSNTLICPPESGGIGVHKNLLLAVHYYQYSTQEGHPDGEHHLDSA
jgi:TPR repeat protein